MKYSVLKIAFVLSLFVAGCGEVPVIDVQKPKGDTLKENIINANRHIANSEQVQIANYLSRRQWDATQLSCGAHVHIDRQGSGPQVGYEDTVSIRYRLEGIDGETIYDAQEETLVAGQMQPTAGFDAALLTLREGCRAHVLMPSELGYGVVGDGERVKRRRVLVYDVEVLKVKKLR